MGEFATPFGIITRGPLILRDLDVLVEAARMADVSVTFSVPTLDREIWRLTEPGTAPPRQRLRALRTLVDHGIKASVGMAPILPGLSDRPELLDDVVKAARDAGATGVWANLLYLKPGTREHFLDHLARDWPELLPGLRAPLRPQSLRRQVGRRAAAGARRRPPRAPRHRGPPDESASSPTRRLRCRSARRSPLPASCRWPSARSPDGC